MHANKRRIALSIVLDFLLVYGAVSLFLFFSSIGTDYAFVVAVFITGLAHAVLHGAVASPGMHMLGIDREYAVDEDIAMRESWLTVMVGSGMVWSGMEEALRWIALPFPMPYFGLVASMGLDMVIALVHGSLYVAAGWLILRMSGWGLWLGLALGLADVCSIILSWSLWDKLVPFLVGFRRHAQGLPVREGEVEFMQFLLPEVVLVISLLVMVALLANWSRFTTSRP